MLYDLISWFQRDQLITSSVGVLIFFFYAPFPFDVNFPRSWTRIFKCKFPWLNFQPTLTPSINTVKFSTWRCCSPHWSLSDLLGCQHSWKYNLSKEGSWILCILRLENSYPGLLSKWSSISEFAHLSLKNLNDWKNISVCEQLLSITIWQLCVSPRGESLFCH